MPSYNIQYTLYIYDLSTHKLDLGSSPFSSSPWGENVEPTPKLETGWATFDSSFGEPMVTNGDTTIDHDLFPDLIKDINMQEITPPFDSPDKTKLPVENLTCKSCCKLRIYYL